MSNVKKGSGQRNDNDTTEDSPAESGGGHTKLVIVESPTKARTIGKYLGKGYKILASMGHVRDLPENRLGVDVKNNFAPSYQETGRKNVAPLREAARKSDEIFLATDPDREGEAIAWHIQELLAPQSKKAHFCRVEFHEITSSAIKKAFNTPRDINIDLVNAQQARRILDRLVGYQVSPLLWSNILRGISAGRVQSVALRLVCERERQIQSFVPRDYWIFLATLAKRAGETTPFPARLMRIDGGKAEVGDPETAARIVETLSPKEGKPSAELTVVDVKTEQAKKYAPPPFITSSMQQAAGTLLGYSATNTMRIAQQLYEGVEIGAEGPTGLITYMRTDSFTIANEARSDCREFIAKAYGPDYVPSTPNVYKNKSSAQEAHEAIRPTDVRKTPESLKSYLGREQFQLYKLVWTRFVASQMAPALLTKVTMDASVKATDGHEYSFRANASKVDFLGFTKLFVAKEKEEKEEEEKKEADDKTPENLPQLAPGDKLGLLDLKSEKKTTEPPPRYSEATLIRELETNGIGRPSTYATIVNTIQKRKYVLRTKGKLMPQELGFKVNDYLVATLPKLFDVGFTAEMETKLDDIEGGRQAWTAMLENFYTSLAAWIDEAKYDDAPEKDKVDQLIAAIDENVKDWDEPRSAGKRSFSDAKFFKSLKSQFAKSGRLSTKQWNSLLGMCGRYSEKVPSLAERARSEGFLDAARAAVSGATSPAANGLPVDAATAEAAAKAVEMSRLYMSHLEALVIPPSKEKKGFDEGDFLESLRKQAKAGKAFSPRQLNALKRLVANHKDSIPAFQELTALLGVDVEQTPVDPALAASIVEILTRLEAVKEWAPAEKKGRRIYDDKAFYESLASQHKKGKALSHKQVAALNKLSAKYLDKTNVAS